MRSKRQVIADGPAVPSRRRRGGEADWRSVGELLTRRSFDRGPLLRARERRFGLLKRIMGQGAAGGTASWTKNLGGLKRSFGLHPHGALSVEPHRWAQFHEPQITRGLCHFLSTGPTDVQRLRARAMMAALWGERMPRDFEVEVSTALAEDGRIDLVIVLTEVTGRRISAIVEAKFGHHITPHQLQRYRKLVTARWQLAPDDRRLLVVMPALNTATKRVLRRNEEWRFLSWQRLLVRLDNALDRDIDDEDFRRFRRTIWLRAYGS